jgi:hypothetical protein
MTLEEINFIVAIWQGVMDAGVLEIGCTRVMIE